MPEFQSCDSACPSHPFWESCDFRGDLAGFRGTKYGIKI